MAKQVNIASLTIDTDNVVKESVRLKKVIDGLKKSQKELKDSGEDTSEQYVEQEAQIKKLNKSYRDNQKFVESLNSANEDLNKTLQSEGKSRQELLDSRAQLNQISKQVIGNTEEEVELREQLNKAIDDQTEKIKELSPGYIKQKEEIGAYTEGINKSDLSLRGLTEQATAAGGANVLFANTAKLAITGLKGMIKASLAFIATPIGAVLGAIVGVFLLVKNAMNRNEEATTKVKKAFSAFTGIVKGLMKFLEPLGTFLIDGLVAGFELVEKGVFKALGAIQRGLKFLGLDDAAASLGNFTENIKDSVKASKELVDAELAFEKAQRLARITQLKFLKEAELLRQIRDDESKTIPERIKANKELGDVLKEQLTEELILAQAALEVAKLKIKLDGETKDALDEQSDALTEIADIQERITGQVSEQLVNRVALEKEATEAIKEINDAELDRLEEDAKKKAEIAKEASDKAIELAKENKEKADEAAEIEKERKLIDAENEFALLELQSENEFELNQKWLDKNRAAELAAAKKTGADKVIINKKFDSAERKLQADLTLFKQEQNQQILSGIKGLFSESSLIGKAFAIAEIANNTAINAGKAFAQAAVFAANPLTLPLAANANIQGGIIIASGAAQIAKTSGIKFSKGDILKGRSHANGGIPFALGGQLGFEAESGESLINKKSTSMFAPLLSAINVAGGGKKFANGDFLGSSTSAPATSLIDLDLLAQKVSEANASLPAPVVSVEEINTVNTGVEVVENLSTS